MRRWLVPVGLASLGGLVGFRLASHARTLLLFAEMFPQVPIKPLRFLTRAPIHRSIRLADPPEGIVADLYLPRGGFHGVCPRAVPAVILCTGLKTQQRDRENLAHLAATLARLGYVAMWPRLEILDRGQSVLERPSTFVRAHQYLASVEQVDPGRISFVGFSVGSSVAFAAATDPKIADRVRALLFFGGYYDLPEYLLAVATGTTVCDGNILTWHADDGAVAHVRSILEQQSAPHLLRALSTRTREEALSEIDAAPPEELAPFRSANPADRVAKLKARIFILHDEGDHYVPYTESVALDRALGARPGKEFLITHLFEHTLPRAALARAATADVARLLAFLAELFRAL
ncbi:MAG TPA: alpha/beta hydrolase [Chloroflexota bacterium]|nr:alpha/beta hydrolase [Chloroflexota bacterium]